MRPRHLVAALVALALLPAACSDPSDDATSGDAAGEGATTTTTAALTSTVGSADASPTGEATADGDAASTAVSDLAVVERSEWAAHFEDAGVVGTFVLHRIGTTEVHVHAPDRAATPVLPASTFKILNSLIALEHGIVADVDEVVPWDGVVRPIEVWNQDHSLRTGIEVSAVWMYQHVAREIGAERMAAAVEAADYGNRDIGGAIDAFWLRGDLRITPLEQLDLLARLVADDLPFEPPHQAAVRDILIRERGDGWVWAHKTGTALSAEPVLGWLVGYTTNGDDTWVFAMNLDLGSGGELDGQIAPQARITLSRTILEEVGALPAGSS